MLELFIAFGAGLISFLSPCVLPLIPGYISYISGSSLNELIEINDSYIFKHHGALKFIIFFSYINETIKFI